jgi:hypothetical protein
MDQTNTRIADRDFEAAKARAVALRNEAMRKLVDALWRGMTKKIELPPAIKPGRPHPAA